MRTTLIAGLSSFLLSVILGIITIPFLKRIKCGQPVLKYVEEHKQKNGTPTMGGLFFIVSAILIYFIFGGGSGRLGVVSVTIGFSFMLIGLLDDYIKIRFKKNEGLKSYQKIIFQTAVAIVAGVFAYKNGITIFYVPFVKDTVDLGYFTIPLVTLIFVAITNSVNLTDGLDGLAGSVSVVYLIFISILIGIELTVFQNIYTRPEEYKKLILLSVTLIGGILGFLLFNVNRASVFMGDTGSLSLGGFLGAISIFSSNSFFIVIIGIMFVLSSISVIIQVVHYKRTKRRVFLMAPLHHHFQLKGYSESKIAFVYSVVTCICGTISIIFYM